MPSPNHAECDLLTHPRPLITEPTDAAYQAYIVQLRRDWHRKWTRARGVILMLVAADVVAGLVWWVWPHVRF